ncbi:hypothetical protein [Streptosporangium sp. KLBMP 9127]|nr:hypothetical protein [Streptosporangium sp. KLBMP 9127]
MITHALYTAVIATQLTLSCGTMPAPAPRHSAPVSATAPSTLSKQPLPLTQDKARRIHARYQRLATKAAHTKDDSLHRAATGLALKISKGESHLATLRRQQPTKPAAITDARFTIPRPLPGQPHWFLVSFTRAGYTTRVQLIFAEAANGWRLAAGSSTPATQRLPQPALDRDGLATALDEHTGGLIGSPRQVAHAHAISLSTLNSHPQALALLAPGTYTSEAAQSMRSEYAAAQGRWALRISARDLPTLYTLRTQDGGALTWYGVRQTQTYTRAIRSAAPINFSKPSTALLSRGRIFTRRAVITAASWFLATIPPTTTRTKASVAGDWYITLGVRGS